MALEEACAEAANHGQVLICHRGTLDALAYWLRNDWDESEFFALTAMSPEQHLQRYFGVIHLQTAAIGAETHYHRWPDAHRPETLVQAAEIDRLCARAWSGHPKYALIDNASRNWADKAQATRDLLTLWVVVANE